MKKLFCMLLAAAMLLSLAACAKAPAAADEVPAVADETPTWQSQYDLGVRYLSEGKYEEAILAFTAAIEIDPKNPDAYIKLAEAYEQTGDDEAALRTLEQGFSETQSERLTQEENRIKRKILQENPAVAELPAAADNTGSTNYDAGTERLYRSVILDEPDGAPVQFAMITDAEYGGIWLHRYTVSEDTAIQDEKLIQLHTEGGRTDFYVYYDAQLGCFCAANAATYYGTPSGAWGCVVKLYTLRADAQELHDWSWNSVINFFDNDLGCPDIDAMQRGRLPYYPDYFDDNYSVILNPELLGECYWLYKHDSFNEFPSEIRVQDGWMVEWTSEELARFDLEMHARAADDGEKQENSEMLTVPDWPSRLSSVVYFGDVSNCHMSREAAEAYAAVLERLPETKSYEQGENYTLQAALVDPGDGYPLLLTCYASEIRGRYVDGWPVMGEYDLPYQVWTFNGKTAERYPFEEETRATWGTDIQFGSFEGRPGIYVRDGISMDVGSSEGCMYYTVSEYQLELQHHLWYASNLIYCGDDPEILQRQEATLQDYLDDGWVPDDLDIDWVCLTRRELDDTVIRRNDPDYAQLTDEYARIQESFQTAPYICYEGSTPLGYIPTPWSSPSELCAALRG